MGIREFLKTSLFCLGQWDPLDFAPSLRQQRCTLNQRQESEQFCAELFALEIIIAT